MQYVYILKNKFVPDLVKFGFSTRNPHDRAAELSAPTGVPGRWTVHYYWEVEDGYAVEQAIFRKLSAYRLDRQEFFRFNADEAVRAISREIGIVGTNPVEKARKEAEAQERARQAAAAQLTAERERLAAKWREFEARKAAITRQIEIEQKPIREAMDQSYNTAYKTVAISIFIISFLINLEKGFFTGILTAVGWVFICYLVLFIPISISISLMTDDSKYHKQLEVVEKRVLALNGLKSRNELEAPDELKRFS